jgi:hypothetical protein
VSFHFQRPATHTYRDPSYIQAGESVIATETHTDGTTTIIQGTVLATSPGLILIEYVDTRTAAIEVLRATYPQDVP